MSRKKKLKEYVYPVMFVCLSIITGLAVYYQGVQSGWIPILTGGNGNGTGTNETVIPLNELGFSMTLIAVKPDGTNFTISQGASLPGLQLSTVPVQVNGQTISRIQEDGVVGFQSSSSFSDSARAEFNVNLTAINLETGYVKWEYEQIMEPFINGGTLSLATLPEIQLTAAQVFNNLQCGIISNGTTLCTPTSSAPSNVQINFYAAGNVTVTDPSNPGLAFVPLGGSYTSEANFGLGGVTACTNCGGGSNVITGAKTSGKVTDLNIRPPKTVVPNPITVDVNQIIESNPGSGRNAIGVAGAVTKDTTKEVIDKQAAANAKAGRQTESSSGGIGGSGGTGGGIGGGHERSLNLIDAGSVVALNWGNLTTLVNWPFDLSLGLFVFFCILAVGTALRPRKRRE